ncbi:MAG: heparinase II/III family protein [Armatimonadetes bacterium]|nr:heparinase II/III family protein [Armatimonadota bacterium]
MGYRMTIWAMPLLVAWTVGAQAQETAAADLSWPKEWTAFGPVAPVREVVLGGLPTRASLLPGDRLKAIPRELVIRSRALTPQRVLMRENRVDLGRWFDGVERGRTVYLFARVTVEQDTQVQVGTGADWFVQWWVDGQPVFDTLGMGNQAFPIAITNHVFSVPLTKGEHVLAVAVVSGSNSFVFAAGGPQELKAGEKPRKSPVEIRAEAVRVLADEKAGAYERAEALLQTAKSYADEGSYARARAEYARVATFPSHASYQGEAQLGIADTYWAERDFPAAMRAYNAVMAVDGGRQEHQAAARKRLDALQVKYRIRPAHPRLFFNDETWPAVKARVDVAELRRAVNRDVPEEIVPKDWGNVLMQAALLYRVTGDQALLDRIRAMLRASLAFYHQVYASHTTDNPSGGAIRAAAIDYPFTRIGWLAAFDWVWNDLTPQEREELCSSMVRHVHEHLSRFPGVRYWHMAFYSADNMYWYAALVLLGPELDGPDTLRAMELLQEGFFDQQRMLKLRGEARADDGDFTTVQIEYTLAGDPHAEWHFLHSWESAIGKEMPAEWRHSRLFPNFVFWSALPGFRHFGLGFAWHTSNNLDRYTLPYHLGQHLHFYGKTDPELAALSRYLQEQMGTRGGSGRLGADPYAWSDLEQAPPAKVPENLPLARHFEGSGMVFMRSGYGPKDTYALFNAAGARFSSDHYDATHFSIYKQGFLALDTGTRNSSEPGHSGNYYPQTVAHNSVLIYMPGETFLGEWGEPVTVNSGGQKLRSRRAKRLAFETGPYFAYAASDATETYAPEKCAQMVRQFLYLPPDHFVVFDRVVSTKAEYPKTWLLHTGNEPMILGKEFRADQEQGRLFCRTVYPLDAPLEKIGGKGKEFWVDGKNWALPDDWPYWGLVKSGTPGIGEHEVPPIMGRWRVEVKPGAARTDDCFLHLIQASDQTVEKMVESQVRDRGNQVELSFTVGARTYTLALNKTGEIGGQIRIAEGDKVLVDRPLTREIMPQAGLALMP